MSESSLFSVWPSVQPCPKVVAQSSEVPRLPSTAELFISLKCPGFRIESFWSPSLARKALLSNPSVKNTLSCSVGFFGVWYRLFLSPCLPSVFSCSRSPSLSAHTLLLWSPSLPDRTGRAYILFFNMRHVLNTGLKLNTRWHFTSAGKRALHSYFPSLLSLWCPSHSNTALNLS